MYGVGEEIQRKRGGRDAWGVQRATVGGWLDVREGEGQEEGVRRLLRWEGPGRFTCRLPWDREGCCGVEGCEACAVGGEEVDT